MRGELLDHSRKLETPLISRSLRFAPDRRGIFDTWSPFCGPFCVLATQPSPWITPIPHFLEASEGQPPLFSEKLLTAYSWAWEAEGGWEPSPSLESGYTTCVWVHAACSSVRDSANISRGKKGKRAALQHPEQRAQAQVRERAPAIRGMSP